MDQIIISENRKTCKYWGICSGCALPTLEYPQQLQFKEKAVFEEVKCIINEERLSKLIRPILPSYNPFHYRNRGDFTLQKKEKLLGFRIKENHQFIHIEECELMHKQINEILAQLQGKTPFQKTHNVLIRYGVNTKDFLVQPEFSTVQFQTGQKYFTERLLHRKFSISASSFFQVNTLQAENLIKIILKYISSDDKIIIDAYSGVGTFSVFFAEKAHRIIAIEESYSAYKDSQINISDLKNIEPICDKTENILSKMNLNADLIVLDPPRIGCKKKVLDKIADLKIKKIIYISCNLISFINDLKYLIAKGYQILEIQPIDMFPQTKHIENIALLAL